MMQTFDYFCARLDQRLTKHYQSSLGNLVRSQNVSTNKSFRRLLKERKKERKREKLVRSEHRIYGELLLHLLQ